MSDVRKSTEEEQGSEMGTFVLDGTQNPFELPRAIIQQLRTCAEDCACGDSVSYESVRFLWIRIAAFRPDFPPPSDLFTLEDWLNVVDEAAALGAQFVIICTGEPFKQIPDVWKICQWAQSSYGLNVGIHTHCPSLDEADLERLLLLDPDLTWLFVRREHFAAWEFLEQHQIHVMEAEVCPEDHSPPCSMPDQMVFVGPDGTLYTCGLVVNNERFRLGHAAEKPLEHIINDPGLPRAVPVGVPRGPDGCDGCPPLMLKRMHEN